MSELISTRRTVTFARMHHISLFEMNHSPLCCVILHIMGGSSGTTTYSLKYLG